MIISDEKYNSLKSKALGLQTGLDVNVIDISIAKTIVNDILNLQLTPQPPQLIVEPAYDTYGRGIKEDMLSPYSIERLFIGYLKNTYDITKPFIHRWEPKDRLSEDELKKILNITKNNIFYKSFEEATDDFLASDRKPHILDFDTELVINNFYKRYEPIYPNLKSIVDQNDISLEDIFICTLAYDQNVKELLNQTNLTRLDIVIYDSSELESYYDKCINWLLKTQGYTKEYLYSKKEVDKSMFLSSLSNALELNNRKQNPNPINNPIELVILAYTDDFNHAIALGNKKNIVINKSARLFFRDKNEGYFGPTITLDSNIIVDENAPILNIRFNCSRGPSYRKSFDLKTINTD